MRLFDRLSMGWDIALTSLQVVNDNRHLLLLPVLSMVAMLVVVITFTGGIWILFPALEDLSREDPALYVFGFLYYFVNYFVIVLFNVALIHCATMAMLGKPYTLRSGFKVARLRLGKILTWSIVGASVGTALNALQESGHIGNFLSAVLGVAWSVMTFFILPIIIYENLSVVDAIKASTRTMKRTWGESLGAQFSFGLLYVVGLVPTILIAWLVFRVNPVAGVVVGLFFVGITMSVVTAANSVFVAATYLHTRDKTNAYFRGRYFETAFTTD